MAYRLKAGESVPEGVRRVVLEEIDSAIKQLSRRGVGQRDEAIHEARKSIKKIRGVLRLIRPRLGPVYREENTRLRDIGRGLSEIRDAQAIIEVFDGVVDKYKDHLQSEALASIRQGLEKSKREMEQGTNVEHAVRAARATLRSLRGRVSQWPLESDGFQAIAAGLEGIYRRGRKAMSAARKKAKPEDFHEWRKRVKDHWYHVRLLESLWTDIMRTHEASLKELETWLGDDHNLVVLHEKLERQPQKFGEENAIQLFTTLADRHQEELRENAMSLGERIYEEKPRDFTRRMSNLWDAWRQQPDSIKEIQDEERKTIPKEPGQAPFRRSKRAVA